MKTGRLVLVAVGIAFVAGGFLGNYLPKFDGFGLGSGWAGTGTEGEKASNPTAATPVTKTTTSELPQDLTDEGQVLRVQIDGEKYAILSASGAATPTSLYEVVSEAKEKQGNADGIRIRVSRLTSSRYEAEKTLKDKLIERGIPESAQDWMNGPPP